LTRGDKFEQAKKEKLLKQEIKAEILERNMEIRDIKLGEPKIFLMKNFFNSAITTIFFALILCNSNLYADSEYAGDFLTLGVGARPLAMGGSFVAISDDSTATYWNPAGLGNLNHSEAGFMRSSLFGLDNYNFFNYIQPLGNSGTAGLSWFRVGIEDINFTKVPKPEPIGPLNRPEIVETFSSSSNAFILSYGKSLEIRGLRFLTGGNLKFLFVSAYKNFNAFGLGADVGTIWETHLWNLLKSGKFSVGLTIQDIGGTKLFWNTPPESPDKSSRKDIINPNFKLGLAYQQKIPILKSRVLLTVDTNSLYSYEMHYGFEYELAELLSLRLGLEEKKGMDTARNFTAGAGLKISFVSGSAFFIDYAYLSSELGNCNRISVMIRF